MPRVFHDDEGATAIEYGLIAALIAVVAIGAMKGIGDNLKGTFEKVSGNMGTAAAP